MGGSRPTTTSVWGVLLLGRMNSRLMEVKRILKSWVCGCVCVGGVRCSSSSSTGRRAERRAECVSEGELSTNTLPDQPTPRLTFAPHQPPTCPSRCKAVLNSRLL